jgi:hypothetical protein
VSNAVNTTTVVFDHELKPEGLDETKWSATINDKTQSLVSATAVDNTVVVVSEDGAENVESDRVSYDDTAGDVRTRFGQASAVSFDDFPIT